MIILDTNVLSELMRPAPDAGVETWMARTPASQTAIAAPSLAEILHGLRRMPDGARKADKTQRFTAFAEALSIFPFDDRAAALYAVISCDREAAGRPISVFDAQIAAIARLRGASVATRDRSGFEATGVSIVDPWTNP